MERSSAENPWPLRVVHGRFSEYVRRLGDVWVVGELSSLRDVRHSVYVTIRDPQGDTSADLMIQRQVFEGLPRRPAEGDRIVALVSLQVTRQTKVLLRVRDLRLQGVGDLMAQLERLRATLAAEGLFAAGRKHRPPLIPRAVGVVAGRDSDALKDVRRIATQRWPAVRLVVREVAVQGRGAVAQVRSALTELDDDPEVDVIILTRGGGSFEDLLPFSDEGLVRHVAALGTPVISAIGHEADRPIVDDVADLRAATPTHAATLAVPDAEDLLRGIRDTAARMRNRVERHIIEERRRLALVADRPVLRQPGRMVSVRRERLATATARMRELFGRGLDDRGQLLDAAVLQLRALSPQATLERGYAVVTDGDGAVVRTPPPAGSTVSVRVRDGVFEALTGEGGVGGGQ